MINKLWVNSKTVTPINTNNTHNFHHMFFMVPLPWQAECQANFRVFISLFYGLFPWFHFAIWYSTFKNARSRPWHKLWCFICLGGKFVWFLWLIFLCCQAICARHRIKYVSKQLWGHMKFYSHKLKLTEFSRLVFNRFFLESVILVNNVSSVVLVLIMHLIDHRRGIVLFVI